MKGRLNTMGLKMSLGRFIADRRKCLHMTQEELAEKINVSKSAIAKWETNGGIPDRDNLKSLSEAIHVSVDDVYRIINSINYKDVDLEVNITAEIIALLESYGYKVIRPGEEDDKGGFK